MLGFDGRMWGDRNIEVKYFVIIITFLRNIVIFEALLLLKPNHSFVHVEVPVLLVVPMQRPCYVNSKKLLPNNSLLLFQLPEKSKEC